jgi:hypothetical protein
MTSQNHAVAAVADATIVAVIAAAAIVAVAVATDVKHRSRVQKFPKLLYSDASTKIRTHNIEAQVAISLGFFYTISYETTRPF